MDLVPLVSNNDNKIAFLMSTVNNNRSGPTYVSKVLLVCCPCPHAWQTS